MSSPRSEGDLRRRPNAAIEDRDIALQVMVPARVKRAVTVRAAHEGVTQRTIILQALRAIGFSVEEDDLLDKRKVR